MRGADTFTESLFSFRKLDDFVPASHPLRSIRVMANEALAKVDRVFAEMYEVDVKGGRPSIAPEKLLRAMLIQILYSVRSERQLMEQVQYNLLFRWFIGLAMDDVVWVPTVFTKNRERLIKHDAVIKFFNEVVAIAEKKDLLSSEHFRWYGRLPPELAAPLQKRERNLRLTRHRMLQWRLHPIIQRRSHHEWHHVRGRYGQECNAVALGRRRDRRDPPQETQQGEIPGVLRTVAAGPRSHGGLRGSSSLGTCVDRHGACRRVTARWPDPRLRPRQQGRHGRRPRDLGRRGSGRHSSGAHQEHRAASYPIAPPHQITLDDRSHRDNQLPPWTSLRVRRLPSSRASSRATDARAETRGH
ncbi:protein of unknown function (plasmid) [Caballeronia sp. S22]